MGWIKSYPTFDVDPDLLRLCPVPCPKPLTIRAIGYIDNEGHRLLER
jgi:hypothetical protein